MGNLGLGREVPPKPKVTELDHALGRDKNISWLNVCDDGMKARIIP